MLAVTRALMTRSEVLLFDEMCTGLAPVIVEQLLEVARTLAGQGSTVILAEASIGPIREAIDDGIVLVRGAVVERATGGEALQEAYRSAMGVTG
jgi:branched-chain amino acid transport system ATP-binding protein